MSTSREHEGSNSTCSGIPAGMGMKLIQHGRRWHPRRERCRSRLGGSATANFRLKMPDARSKRSGSDDFVRPMLK